MNAMIDRIRDAAAKAAAGPLADAKERPAYPRVAALSPFSPEVGPDELVERFSAELEAVAAFAHGPFDAAGVAAEVAKLIAGAGGRGPGAGSPHPHPLPEGEGTSHPRPPSPDPWPPRVLSWAPDQLGCPGLADALARAGVELVPGDVPNDENHQRVLEEHAQLDVGLSGVVAGLADTGSILVASGPGRSRIASLLPPVHIAILPVDRLYPTMQDWIADGGVGLARDTANLVVITGSSRTSDIELQLTLGMHGPKELHVVLYRG